MPNMLFANVDGKIFEIDAASGSESNFVAVFRDDAVSRVLPGEGERVERIRPAVGAAIWARGFIMRRLTACRPCLSTSVWTRSWGGDAMMLFTHILPSAPASESLNIHQGCTHALASVTHSHASINSVPVNAGGRLVASSWAHDCCCAARLCCP